MIQKHHLSNSLWYKRAFLLASFLCLTATTAWSQTMLTVSGTQMSSSKVYDGTTIATVIPGTITGILGNDTVTIATATANYNTPVVGTNKRVCISYTLSGPQASNYVVKDDTLYADIVTRQLGILGVEIAPKVYDHNIGANLSSMGHLTNLIASDSGSVSVNISCSYLTCDAGLQVPVAMQYSINGPAANNYIAPIADTLYGIIHPRAVYASGVEAQSSKVYDGTASFFVTNHGVIDSGNVLNGDTVFHTTYVYANSSNQTNGFNTLLNISFLTSGPQGSNYVVYDTIDQLWGMISKLDVEIESPIIKFVKEYDGNNIVTVLQPAVGLNFIEGDTLELFTFATYDNAQVGYDKPITIHYDLQGARATNYKVPADTVYTTGGAIIMPTVLDTVNGQPVNALVSGFCQGDSVRLQYKLRTGHPTAYQVTFNADALAQGFQNTNWTPCTPADSIISFVVPANCQGGHYQASITFVNLASVLSDEFTAPFTVNLSNQYLVQVFDDVLSIDNSGRLDNQPNRFRSFKWYHNNELINESKPYHQEMGGLTGTYYVLVNAGSEDENVVCPWNESQYIATTPSQVVHVNPSPVVNQALVKLQGQFENETHLLRVFNSYGNQVHSTTFTGRAFTLDMSTLPQGTYLINVDGATAKTIKL